MSVPLKINGKHLYELMLTADEITALEQEIGKEASDWDDTDIDAISIKKCLYPTEVTLTSETYSRNASRTADYELEQLELVNRKAKPEFRWNVLKAQYVQRLLSALKYDYNFKNTSGVVEPQSAPTFAITYTDFVGTRTAQTYLGQTIEGVLEEYEGIMYWRDFRIAFPER